MKTQQQILAEAAQHTTVSSTDLSKFLGVSRQYITRQLATLVAQGKLVKIGSTNRAKYALPTMVKQHPELFSGFHKTLVNTGLKEHEILENIETAFPVILQLKENIKSIFQYAFSEMLNNAIEHSSSKRIQVTVSRDQGSLIFTIDDFGVGAFLNVMKKRQLQSEREAAQDLLKGKTTTQPQAHSGEGIFFTSKVADLFLLESHQLRLRINNLTDDVYIEDLARHKQGTRIIFRISETSTRHLLKVFNKFSNISDDSDYGFDRTEIQVRLYTKGGPHVSRSQARRILSGLEKFKSIIFDFDQVPMVGQAFADEIFRVFQHRHPKITLQPIRMNDTVKFMVNRVGK